MGFQASKRTNKYYKIVQMLCVLYFLCFCANDAPLEYMQI